MTFIDWSDSEGMIDLFQEFVRDEMNECLGDTERGQFLNQMLEEMRSIREAKPVDALARLRAVRDSIQAEFSADPVSLHLADLIHELEGLT